MSSGLGIAAPMQARRSEFQLTLVSTDSRTSSMSKIFEALKQAELARANDQNATAVVTSVVTRAAKRPERRRTTRLNVQVPLFVYGYTPDGNPFFEDACTIAINTHGGLIFMPTIVRPGQRLLVTKEGDEQAKEGIVG